MVRVECLGGDGAGIGGVLGGGGEASVMVTAADWTPIEEWWVDSSGSSLTGSDLISGKSDCSNLTVGKVYGSLWSSSSAEGLGSQSGESRSMGMAWMRSSLGGRGRAKTAAEESNSAGSN